MDDLGKIKIEKWGWGRISCYRELYVPLGEVAGHHRRAGTGNERGGRVGHLLGRR